MNPESLPSYASVVDDVQSHGTRIARLEGRMNVVERGQQPIRWYDRLAIYATAAAVLWQVLR